MKKEFCSTNGFIKYAGVHLIVELWDAKNLTSLALIRKALKDAVTACQATLLKIDLHQFSPSGGISGVAIIQESHISIHTWPEYKYAALDIFVCGEVDPYKAIPLLKERFKPKRIQVAELKRGHILMWYYEALFNDVRLALEGKLIYGEKTPYQNLQIYQTSRLGKILVLDKMTQTAEKDEFIYHEMVTHPLLLTHPRPEKVLIIGAGDGGVLREVLKHDVKQAYLVEIDERVINLSIKYLPSLSKGAFSDKRTRLIIADGAQFIRQTREKFDVVIIDSPDPVGMAKVLFTRNFYVNIFSILGSSGMMIRQTGSTMFQPNELQENYRIMKKIFPFVTPQLAAVPTYIGGFFSFIIGSKKINPPDVPYKLIAKRYAKSRLNTKYYNPDIHFASMKLPNYLRRVAQ